MSNENNSIHEFDFSLICEYFSHLERQGPGSPEITKEVAGYIKRPAGEMRTADIGCGTGGQTMVLAGQIPGVITGIDLFPAFIDLFNQNAARLNLHDRVKGIAGSMDNLPFGDGELDLIWSEGAIYNIGFEKGLREWRRFLKPGGYIAVSEVSWFTDERPLEIEEFWQDAYPLIDTIPNKLQQMEKAGYEPLAHINLPENCWTDNFYDPQVSLQEEFLKKYIGNKTAEDFIASERHEYQLYKKYKDFYGYTFYIARV